MYTEGIRKIYSCQIGIGHIDNICNLAEEAGYKALTFNGEIYVFAGKYTWIKTEFKIDDFKTN
jgi:hypothetical protein